MTVIHATCISLNGSGVLLRGPSGSGKSDLALRLIDAGAVLVADDYCTLTHENGRLVAVTPDAIAGKLEVRGLGILTLPFEKMAAVRLVVDLEPKDNIERLPETTTCKIEETDVPQVFVDADTPSAAAKVRMALLMAGDANMRSSVSA